MDLGKVCLVQISALSCDLANSIAPHFSSKLHFFFMGKQ